MAKQAKTITMVKGGKDDNLELQRRTYVVDANKEQYDIEIDEGTLWRNPFHADPNRPPIPSSLKRYRDYILHRPMLARRLESLAGKRLGTRSSYIKSRLTGEFPHEHHGQVLADLADKAAAGLLKVLPPK